MCSTCDCMKEIKIKIQAGSAPGLPLSSSIRDYMTEHKSATQILKVDKHMIMFSRTNNVQLSTDCHQMKDYFASLLVGI